MIVEPHQTSIPKYLLHPYQITHATNLISTEWLQFSTFFDLLFLIKFVHHFQQFSNAFTKIVTSLPISKWIEKLMCVYSDFMFSLQAILYRGVGTTFAPYSSPAKHSMHSNAMQLMCGLKCLRNSFLITLNVKQ